MSQYLFVGGAYDGQRMHADRSTVLLPVPVHLPVALSDDRPEVPYEEYELTRLRGSRGELDLYVLSSMTSGEMLQALVDGYRPISCETCGDCPDNDFPCSECGR